MYEGLRLMAVHAHPDDESSKGAPATVKYVQGGARVMVVSCTGGERGDVLNEQLKGDPHIQRDIAQVRRDEMAAALEVLGCEHTWLGFVDSGLPEGDPLPPLPAGCFALEDVDVAAEALVRVIRSFRPHVVTTYDEVGGYPHPDHVMTHTVSMAAFEAAGDPERFPHAGAPWQPLKLYYNSGFSRERITALHEGMLSAGLESPYGEWLDGWKDRRAGSMTTRVPAGEFFQARDRALLAHRTQVDPDGSWFRVPMDVQLQAWPTDDFELALSYVPVDLPEECLFEGLPDAAESDTLAGGDPAGRGVQYDGRAPAPDSQAEAVDAAEDHTEAEVERATEEEEL